MSEQQYKCKVDYNSETDQVIFTVSEQPQEWTEGKVFAYFESEDIKGLADAINAALAANAKATEGKQEWTRNSIMADLAADEISEHTDWRKVFDKIADAHNAALAAAKQEGIDWADKQYYGVSGHQRIRELEQQLAAGREKREKMMQYALKLDEWNNELQDREKLLAEALELCLDALGDCDDTAKRLAAVLNGNTALAKVKEIQ